MKVAPLTAGPGATTGSPFVVTANEFPVVEANGPYEVLVDGDLNVDFTGSFDPDGGAVTVAGYDFDGDGEFDAFNLTTLSASILNDKLCGGQCAPGTDYTITAVLAAAATSAIVSQSQPLCIRCPCYWSRVD